MADMNYADAPFDIRGDLTFAHAATWDRIKSPGTWFDGETRVAIAAETRNAVKCCLCLNRKDALSPITLEGTHDSLGELPEEMVEVIHRIVTDPGRLTQKWYQDRLESGLSAEKYVEILGVTCSTIAVDTFADAAGLSRRALPAPNPGQPSRIRPPLASQGAAWVPWISPDDGQLTGIADFAPEASNVRRAMSLVPDEAVGFMSLVGAQYIEGDAIQDFSKTGRSLDRQQIELIAGRISAINQCAY
ncbi:MAG: hypothetical protein CMI96_05015 [Pelagibacteraceae bacterium]|nr:hypothetical protein [Pelagibacteraceae bacterium]PPR10016.1 MAG: hypothetical protein CFH41_02071 [Alphaproteobacteria bacterium MarineAlpha11_Bin1]|tara:strand:- start:606 stop:1343 length:738 start_codon:yes stop_codon:yes gene_type:complete